MVDEETIKTKLDFVKRFPTTVTIVAICILIFVINNYFLYNKNYIMIYKMYGVTDNTLKNKEYYRFLTCFFTHFNVEHLLGNMLILTLIGYRVEWAVGKLRFILIYFFSGIIGGLLEFFMVSYFKIYQNYVSAGASGAIFGLIGAAVILICFGSKRKLDISKKEIVFLAVFMLLLGKSSGRENINNVGHLCGLICGLFITFVIYVVEKIIEKFLKNGKGSEIKDKLVF